MSIVNQVYRVRTEPQYKAGHHMADKGSLVVLNYKFTDGDYAGFAYCRQTKQTLYHRFRPCDLQRLEFHDEVNE